MLRAEQREGSFAAEVPEAIRQFLQKPSSREWAEAAAADLSTLLIDHGNCELKAASTALSLLHKYPQHDALVWRMSRLAREELRHYEQVRQIAGELGIEWGPRSASVYAAGLRAEISQNEPQRLIDTLIIGAFIEARSCERFALIAPELPDRLARFYRGLLASEARHFAHYLELAQSFSQEPITDRVDTIRRREQGLIVQPAADMRFHSGPPSIAIEAAIPA